MEKQNGMILVKFKEKLTLYYPKKVEIKLLSGNYRQKFKMQNGCAAHLERTLQTANILGIDEPRIDANLEEMNWGKWTGKTLKELRIEHGESFSHNEENGLDFQTPEGESPRDVRSRVCAFLETVEADTRPLCIVTHKGVIRAFISAATGWDLKSDYGEKLKRDVVHHFELNEAQALRLIQLNIPTIP